MNFLFAVWYSPGYTSTWPEDTRTGPGNLQGRASSHIWGSRNIDRGYVPTWILLFYRGTRVRSLRLHARSLATKLPRTPLQHKFWQQQKSNMSRIIIFEESHQTFFTFTPPTIRQNSFVVSWLDNSFSNGEAVQEPHCLGMVDLTEQTTHPAIRKGYTSLLSYVQTRLPSTKFT